MQVRESVDSIDNVPVIVCVSGSGVYQSRVDLVRDVYWREGCLRRRGWANGGLEKVLSARERFEQHIDTIGVIAVRESPIETRGE